MGKVNPQVRSGISWVRSSVFNHLHQDHTSRLILSPKGRGSNPGSNPRLQPDESGLMRDVAML